MCSANPNMPLSAQHLTPPLRTLPLRTFPSHPLPPHLNVSSLPCLTSNAFHSSQKPLSERGSASEAPCT